MGTIEKFLFDRRFDQIYGLDGEALPVSSSTVSVEPEPEEPPPPPPPMFTTAQVEAAREEGYIGGHTAALDEAANATERMAALALAEMGRRLNELQHRHDDAIDDIARDAARLILGVCRKILPATAQNGAVDEVTALVSELLPSVFTEPRLIVRVHPAIADSLRERLDAVAAESGYEGKLTVSADPRVPPTDCKVEWGEGGVERDSARQWAEIEALIDRHLAGAAAPVSDAPEADEPAAPTTTDP
ncbi:flagellar assembly protein FliH [Rhodospirillum rubrum]|uniref:FliH/SctL family protein n=1 Tax=Rhodospirillum rubrum TaxID=1085 RepID=UPI0019082416|nr:FliH/SctL family protein [Rhodospirillum rubrum]MBK1665446.1 flagellar assembly protein FliH [Rhodospirillum rubrum]MBK1677359.1 flagellar assembly protein FliH [Rhodospirillum rubrum]